MKLSARSRLSIRVALEIATLLLLATGLHRWLLAQRWQGSNWATQIWAELLIYCLPVVAFLSWRGLRQAHISLGARLGARLWPPLYAALLTLGLGLAISAAVVQYQIHSTRDLARARFDHLVELLEQDVRRRFELPSYGLRGLVAQFSSGRPLEREEFARFVSAHKLALEFPGIRGFGFIERVDRHELDRFLLLTQADAAPEFKVHGAGGTDPLYVIKYIEPLANNQPALGYDLGSEPVRRQAVERAYRTGLPTLSGRVELLQDEARRSGFLYLLPLHQSGAPLDHEAQRLAATVGLLYAPIVVEELMAGVGVTTQGLLDFVLLEQSSAAGSHTVFHLAGPGAKSVGDEALFRTQLELPVGGQSLLLRINSTLLFEQLVIEGKPFWAGIGGMIMSLLGAAVVWLLGIGRTRALSIAEAMTLDLRQAQAELADRNERFALALEGGSDGLWDHLDTHGEAQWWSPQYYRLLGYEPGAIEPGLLAFDQRLHPDDRERTMQALAAALEDLSPYDVEFRLRTQNGAYRWFRSRAKVFRDASGEHRRMAGSLQDIDELKQVQAQMRARSQQLAAIFALSPDGFVSFDAEQRLSYASPAFCKLSELNETELPGLSIETLLALLQARSSPEQAEIHASTLWREPQTLALGTVKPRILSLSLQAGDGQEVSALLQVRDVTHQFEVDRMKSEFLTTAAHELRTPMVGIYGFTELLMTRDMPPERQKELQARVYRQCQTMMAILNELLDLARIEARGGQDFVYSTVQLHSLVVHTLSEYPVPEGRTPPLLESTAAEWPIHVDPSKLQQALRNILSNAYKYSPEGGTVRLRLRSAEGGALVEVEDQGIGMSPEELAQVTDRFYRADKSGNMLGSGLGMSIVKEIIDLLQGRLSLRSAPGAGCTVSIWLPLATPSGLQGAP